jgi:hypothetical protein
VKRWAWILLAMSGAAGILNATHLHDPEVTGAVIFGATIGLAILAAPLPRKGPTHDHG